MSTDGEVPDPHFLGVFGLLCAPFDPQEVRSRKQAGRELFYITARTAMNRLDNVLGPAGWWDEYIPGENSVLCKLTIRLPDGSTLTKQDAGGYAGMPDQGDDDKSGYSDSFKRACVKFGVGRYLYRDGVPHFARSAEPTSAHPPEVVPAPQRQQQAPQAQRQAPTPREGGRRQQEADGRAPQRDFGDGPPRNGRALFKVLKDAQEGGARGLIDDVNEYLKSQGIKGRMVDLDERQVAMAYRAAMDMLHGGQPDPDPEPQPAMAGYPEDDGSVPF